MSYTRPDFDAADATWSGATTYVRPDFDAADATWYVSVDARYVYIAEDVGVLGSPSIFVGLNRVSLIAVASPLGAPELFIGNAWYRSYVADSGLPLGVSSYAYTDPTQFIDESAPILYFMDLITDGVAVRVPISSWQATLQNDSSCYVQCVVPMFGNWSAAVAVADEFSIRRSGIFVDGVRFEVEMARAPIGTVQDDMGSVNRTGSIQGYAAAFAANETPDNRYDRALVDVRSITNYGGSIRVRCGIDWLLKPSQRAIVGGELNFVVDYINYIVTANSTSIDAYMDVGSRAD